MRRITPIALGAVVAVAVLVGRCTPVAAAKAGPKSVQEIVQAQCEMMVHECKASDEQQKTLQEKFKAKQAALEAWDKTNGEKLKAAEDAAKAARAGADAAAKKKAGDDLRALNMDRAQVAAEADKAILALLSEDQRMTWAGVELAQTTLPKYKKANLSDDQIAKIKSACAIAARDLAAFSGDDRKDKQGRTTVQKSLKWAIDNVVLTPDQRELVQPKPAAKPAAK